MHIIWHVHTYYCCSLSGWAFGMVSPYFEHWLWRVAIYKVHRLAINWRITFTLLPIKLLHGIVIKNVTS
jgi:hypothetical protein